MADFRPTRKKNALDNSKLRLSAPSPVAQGKYASLSVIFDNNNPRFVVYTGEESDRSNNYGKIEARLDLSVFSAFVVLLRNVAQPSTPNGHKDKLDNLNFIYPGGKRSEAPVVVSELQVGKDKETGEIWMAVVAKDRPRIQFKFGPPPMHKNWVHGTGEPFSAGELSAIFAQGYANLIERMVAHLAVTEWVDPAIARAEKEAKQGGQRSGGGGGGGYNRSQGGGQRQEQPAAGFSDMDDDIPFATASPMFDMIPRKARRMAKYDY